VQWRGAQGGRPGAPGFPYCAGVSADPGKGEELAPPAPQKKGETVAAELRSKINRGEIQVGAGLASEAVLVEQLQVSRATLREALRILESENFLGLRRGARNGASVRLPDPKVAAKFAGLVLEANHTALSDVFAARQMIEPSAARLAAAAATSVDIAELTELRNSAGRVTTERLPYATLRVRFHERLVAASHNNTLQLFNSIPNDTVEKTTREAARGYEGTAQRLPPCTHCWHGRIIQLIADAKGDEAHGAWKLHLEETADMLTEPSGPDEARVDVVSR
jgi:DNA-binding FadR family transcriptional regulator